jgi:hypothetical protein
MTALTWACGCLLRGRERRRAEKWPRLRPVYAAARCPRHRERDYFEAIEAGHAAQTPESVATGSTLYAVLFREDS